MTEPRRSQRSESVADYSYTALFEPLEKGGYQVTVPAIPEICTFGVTLDEARAMARDAIRCVIESALKEDEPIPRNVHPRAELLTVIVFTPLP